MEKELRDSKGKFMKGHKHSENSKNKIRESHKEIFNRPEVKESLRLRRLKRKQELGYINSPETRKKLSNNMKEKWKTGDITDNQRRTMFKKGYDKRRENTMTGKHHTEETKKLIKEARAKQVFPMNDSSIELKLQNFLKQLNIEYYPHQYMKEIEHAYQCDIFVPSLNLIIEADGDYWHNYPFGNKLDHIRTEELKDKGFNVLRIWERDIRKMDMITFKEKLEEFR